MGAHGAELINDGDTIIHHCNTGALATVDFGTALGVIRTAHAQGKRVHVLVDETRPRLQGARLTAWELKQYGIPHEIITDNAAGYFLSRGEVAACFVGGDRVAANGDVANKVGTYMLALAAHENNVPFYVVVPISSVDLNLPQGEDIPIEERDPGEELLLEQDGKPIAPAGRRARNPAFDVTPHRLVTAIVTELGILVVRSAEQLKLNRVFLLPNHQGRGLGSQLMRALMREADASRLPIRLRVLRVNPARRLYERLGFVVSGETETHFLMERPTRAHEASAR